MNVGQRCVYSPTLVLDSSTISYATPTPTTTANANVTRLERPEGLHTARGKPDILCCVFNMGAQTYPTNGRLVTSPAVRAHHPSHGTFPWSIEGTQQNWLWPDV